MDIIKEPYSQQYQGYNPDAGTVLSLFQTELSEPLELNKLASEESVEPSDDTEVIIESTYLDELVDDRWVFKFSFGENQEMVAEIVDSETGDVIKQVSFEHNSYNPIGTLFHIRV